MKKKAFSLFLALLFTASLPVSALADTYDLANGDITITASDSGQSVSYYDAGAVQQTNPNDSAPVITQSTDSTSNTVTITGGCEVNVTLDGVNIEASGSAAVTVDGTTTANVTLSGDNTVVGGGFYAGVQVEAGATLNITESSTGSLSATGGTFGAGIGGGNGGSGGNINISGGEVTATGNGGAGIGGGSHGAAGDINISGGEVIATGIAGGAGIGGGNGGSGGNIDISGGDVTATGVEGAGIGGGESGDGGNIDISGGDVTASGKGGGAGIGGGRNGDGGDIDISGGEVIATGDNGGAGIGSGQFGDGGSIDISGGVVTATGKVYAAGIGGGDGYNGGGNGGVINISGGVVTAAGSSYAVDIGSGAEAAPVEPNITGGIVNGVDYNPPKSAEPSQSYNASYIVVPITCSDTTVYAAVIISGNSIKIYDIGDNDLAALKGDVSFDLSTLSFEADSLIISREYLAVIENLEIAFKNGTVIVSADTLAQALANATGEALRFTLSGSGDVEITNA